MKATNNEIKIIQILLSSNDYISTYEIATLIGISRRSVREEIINVKNILKEQNIHLTSKPNKGYIIEGKTPVIINKLQEIINKNESENAYAPVPNMPHDRVNYILKLLAQSDKYIKMDDIADELLVSRATIANDLINVKKELSRYNLHIIHKPNYGIKLNIKELERRRIIADLVFASMTQREVFYDFLDTYLDTSDREIIEIIKNNNLF